MNQPRHQMALFAIATVLLSSPSAFAVVVPPGSTVGLPGTTALAQPGLAGVVIEEELIRFSLPVSPQSQDLITGTVQQRVVREDATGTLDFYWRITELSGGSLGYLRVGNFVTATYDADYRIDSSGDIGPTSLTRFTNGMGGATDDYAANFNFATATGSDTLPPGQSSLFMFLRTDATNYSKSAFFDIASTGTYTASSTFAAFGPAPVPEPATYAMLLAGIAVVGALARRRSPA